MDKECYYLRHKLDQELYAYLELGETWEESFLMEFRMTEVAPHYIKTGALFENRHILLAFKYIGMMDIVEVLRDKKLEWKPVEADEQLKFSAKTLVESLLKGQDV